MPQKCILTIFAKIKFSKNFYSIKTKYSLKNVFLQHGRNTMEPELKVTQSALVKHHIRIKVIVFVHL